MSRCDCGYIGEHAEWCSSHPKNIELDELHERIFELEARNEKLESFVAWLKNEPHSHHDDCPLNEFNLEDYPEYKDQKCDCGYDEWKAKLAELDAGEGNSENFKN